MSGYPRTIRSPFGESVAVGTAEAEAAIRAGWQRRTNRAVMLSTIRDAIDAIRDTSWDFIDSYSPVPVPGSQNPGVDWPEGVLSVGLLAQRIAVLRVEAARTAVQKIRIANALAVLYALEAERIERTDDVSPPPDR